MNDVSISQLGKYYKKKLNVSENYMLFCEKIHKDPHYVIEFIYDVNNVSHEIDTTLYDDTSYIKYAYKFGSSNGGDNTPTTKWKKWDINKKNTKYNSLLKWFEQILDPKSKYLNGQYSYDINLFQDLKLYLTTHKDKLMVELDDTFNNVTANIKSDSTKSIPLTIGFTIKIKDTNNVYHLNDLNIIKDILVNNFYMGLQSKYTCTENYSNSGNCSVCKTTDTKVFGFPPTFKYFTLDKPVYRINSLENSWKTYGVCGDCAIDMYLGKRYVMEKMRYKEYSSDILIIPKVIFNNEKLLEEILLEEEDRISRKNDIDNTEYNIFKNLSKNKNYINRDVIFAIIDSSKHTISIKKKIDDIAPSIIKKVFVDAEENVKSKDFYKNLYSFAKTVYKKEIEEGEFKEFNVNDDIINKFYIEKIKSDNNIKSNVKYEIFEKLFNYHKFDNEEIYTLCVDFFKNEFSKFRNENFIASKTIYRAYVFIDYLRELNLLKNKEVTLMENVDNKSSETKKYFTVEEFKKFVDESKMFFNDSHVGLFALGMLVELTAYYQKTNRTAATIYQKFKNFNFTGKDIKDIFVSAKSKMMQLSKFNNVEMEYILQKYLVDNIGIIEKMNPNEIKFYVMAGLSYNSVKNFINNQKENTNE